MLFRSNGLQAFAFADGQPKARAVNTQLASHAQVAAAVNAAGLKPMGLGSMGANVADAATAAQDYTATTEYSFTLAGPGGLTLGLLDFTGYAQGGAFALTFDVSNSGTSLVHQSFDTLSSADAYFSDHALDLGRFSGHVDLAITFQVSGATAQGAGFSYVLAGGALANSLTLPSAVPEPQTWLMWMAGLAAAAGRARLQRRQPRSA